MFSPCVVCGLDSDLRYLPNCPETVRFDFADRTMQNEERIFIPFFKIENLPDKSSWSNCHPGDNSCAVMAEFLKQTIRPGKEPQPAIECFQGIALFPSMSGFFGKTSRVLNCVHLNGMSGSRHYCLLDCLHWQDKSLRLVLVSLVAYQDAESPKLVNISTHISRLSGGSLLWFCNRSVEG
jgi:hypothetical protein